MTIQGDIERLGGCLRNLDQPIFLSHDIEEDLLLQLQKLYDVVGDGPLYNAFQDLFTYAHNDVVKMRVACQRINSRIDLAIRELRKL